jgi:hypothetical protein
MMALLPPFPLLSSRVERHDIDDETLIRWIQGEKDRKMAKIKPESVGSKESGYNIKATLYAAFYVNAIILSLLAACEILSCQQDYLVWQSWFRKQQGRIITSEARVFI